MKSEQYGKNLVRPLFQCEGPLELLDHRRQGPDFARGCQLECLPYIAVHNLFNLRAFVDSDGAYLWRIDGEVAMYVRGGDGSFKHL